MDRLQARRGERGNKLCFVCVVADGCFRANRMSNKREANDEHGKFSFFDFSRRGPNGFGAARASKIK